MARDDDGPLADEERVAALAACARAGDVAAFARLYERHARALFAWGALRIRPALRAWIEPADLVQEVWARAWRAALEPRADDPPLRAWLLRIAKNVMLEVHRRAERSPAPLEGPGPSTRMMALAALPDDATAISQRVARDDGLERVVAWARGLEEEDRRLFVLCALEGASYAEAARSLGVSRDALAKRWPKLRERSERALGGAL
jgi:RNA polymerase sigma-70 factor (ECF subfamily)